MLKNTFKAVNDYADAYKQANDVYKQTVDYIEKNYKPDSEMYKSGMLSAETVFNDFVEPFKAMCAKEVKNEIDGVRTTLKEIVSKPLDADSLFKVS